MSNSIIESQKEYNWCIRNEIDKCKNDQQYFYENYCLVNGLKPLIFEINIKFFELINKISVNKSQRIILKK